MSLPRVGGARCGFCCAPRPGYQCSRCKVTRYCSVECQRIHWRVGHHFICVPKEEEEEEEEEEPQEKEMVMPAAAVAAVPRREEIEKKKKTVVIVLPKNDKEKEEEDEDVYYYGDDYVDDADIVRTGDPDPEYVPPRKFHQTRMMSPSSGRPRKESGTSHK